MKFEADMWPIRQPTTTQLSPSIQEASDEVHDEIAPITCAILSQDYNASFYCHITNVNHTSKIKLNALRIKI